MNKHTPTEKFVPHAFAVIQEGLQAMQKLQQQTAQAHTKFLESQAQASRAIEAMFASTRRLAETSSDLPFETTPQLKTGVGPEADPGNEIPVENPSPAFSTANTPTSTPAVEPASVVPAVDNPTNTPPAQPSAPQKIQPINPRNENLEQGLLQIVSELTGYPMEMLGLDMDIEADLGIDSIKRVEILSTLEEQMPNLPTVTPEDMGTLKSLGQIIAHLNQDEQSESHVIANSSNGLEPVSQPVATPPDSQTVPLSHDPIEQPLLRIVSELTGYPMEMLGLDMDIEADLGIDSIKRVEILSTLEEQMPGLPSITPEDMGTLKTLGQIIAYLTSDASDEPAVETGVIPLAPASSAASRNLENEKSTRDAVHPFYPSAGSIDRLVVKPKESPLLRENTFHMATNRKLYVLEDASELSSAIVDALLAENIRATLITPEALSKQAPLSDLGGLLIVANQALSAKKQWQLQDGDFLKQAFALTQQVAPALQAAAEQGGALLATVTRLDGAFGFKANLDTNPLMGGLAGLVKTAAIEWPEVACRAIDVAPGWEDANTIAQAIAQELCFAHPDGPIEIGLDVDSRVSLVTQPEPYPPDNDLKTGLCPGDVVVVSGGGRGVTAAALQAVAIHNQPTLILMGRSPAPSPEPDWLTGLKHAHDIKKAILTHVFDSKPPAPRDLEQIYRAHMANREIKNTIASLQATGAKVEYLSLDVRDVDQVATALANVRKIYGPIKGLIHGAGMLADRLITDKTLEQFNRVFGTKVAGLHALLSATRDDALTQIVLFSSVAARTGNRGQVDYAMANEVLNKVAWHEAWQRPDCKITAINWGPWDGGMVSASLKKEFQRNHVPLIDLHEGAHCLVREMASGRAAPAEVVLGGMMPDTSFKSVPKQPDPLSLSFKREIDLKTVPVLGSHMLDGKPVVPLALMAEWFGHGALHDNPGLMLHGFDDLRVLKGIRLDKKKKLVRMMSGKASKNGSAYEVPVELRDGIDAGHEVVHSHARAILSETLPAPPLFEQTILTNPQGYFRSVVEVYEKILFHGSYLRGIQEIISLSDQGMVARVASAPDPEQWITNPHRTRWIGDPLALDCAFQMASLWCYEETGSVSLPSYCASYRQYARVFPSKGLTAVLVVTAHTERKLRADITWLDSKDVVVAQIKGFEAVMDTSLIKAFKPQLVATG